MQQAIAAPPRAARRESRRRRDRDGAKYAPFVHDDSDEPVSLETLGMAWLAVEGRRAIIAGVALREEAAAG